MATIDLFLTRALGDAESFFISSLRAAFTVLLKALKQCSDLQEVVIPAYTCLWFLLLSHGLGS